MGYFSLIAPEPPLPRRTKALMVAACCRFCQDVPGDGEQDLGAEVDFAARTVTVTDGVNTRTYPFDKLV
jgi:hypothetical protein